MSYDDDWADQTIENRRKAITQTIRPITLAELKKLGEKRFPVVTDPWCERYNQFLATHPDSKYFIAISPEGAEVIYCKDSGNGLWFLPEKGMGLVLPKGLKMLAEITANL
ncbi:MAG: hypothetical protein ABIT37_16490 [Luteolibacter sp.]